tara:strand:- start:39 stop:1433 length:1395 start_codon:yes stop_codon:yes gene_type:complete
MGIVGSFGKIAQQGDSLVGGVRAVRSIAPMIKRLAETGKYSARELDNVKRAFSKGDFNYQPRPKRAGDVNGAELVGNIREQSKYDLPQSAAEAAENSKVSPTNRGTPIHPQLANMDPQYRVIDADTDFERITKETLNQKAKMDEALETKDRAFQRRTDRNIKAGNPDKKVYTHNEDRLFQQVKGTGIEYLNNVIRNFQDVVEDLRGRAITSEGPGAYHKGGGKRRWDAGEAMPGEIIPKEVTKQTKLAEGPTAGIEQHHMWSNKDSSIFADILEPFGDVFKFNAYAWIAKKYKMLPGDWDLNMANLPVGPHRLKGQGNLHEWLGKMGFEDYWDDFVKNHPNPNSLSKDEVFEAVTLYFDTVFYPGVIKMANLVENAPTKHEWKGMYIPPYILKDAKNRVAHLSETHKPWELYPEGSTARDVKMDRHIDQTVPPETWDSKQGQSWENIDGLTIQSRPGFPKNPKK